LTKSITDSVLGELQRRDHGRDVQIIFLQVENNTIRDLKLGIAWTQQRRLPQVPKKIARAS
jgi:hypothetical protein